MTALPKSTIKSYFQTGDRPTQAQFTDLIDSYADVSAAGSVFSVALTMPGIFAVAGSPITSAGTIAVTLSAQAAAQVFASPVSAGGAPDFRALVLSDMPNMAANTVMVNASSVAAKPQNLALAASQLLGRGGSGAVAAITLGNSLDLSATTLSAKGYSPSLTSAASNNTDMHFGSLDFVNNIGYQIFFNNELPATTNTDLKIQVTASANANYLDASVGRASSNDNGSGVSNISTGIIFTGQKNGAPTANFVGTLTQPLATGNALLAFSGTYTNNSSIGIGVDGTNTYATSAAITDVKFIQSSGNLTQGTFTLKPIPR